MIIILSDHDIEGHAHSIIGILCNRQRLVEHLAIPTKIGIHPHFQSRFPPMRE